MTNCANCGRKAPEDVEKMLDENEYNGDYFCDEECQQEFRGKEEDETI